MVEDVEELRSELQITLFLTECKLLQECGVKVLRSGPDDDIAPRGSVATRKTCAEACGVEPPRWIVVEAIRIAGDIRPRVGLGTRKLQAGERIQRVPGLDG